MNTVINLKLLWECGLEVKLLDGHILLICFKAFLFLTSLESLHVSHVTNRDMKEFPSRLVLMLYYVTQQGAWVRSHVRWPSVAVCQLGLPHRLSHFPTCWKIPLNIYWMTKEL